MIKLRFISHASAVITAYFVLLSVCASACLDFAPMGSRRLALTRSGQTEGPDPTSASLILPGKSVGPVKLGDSRDIILKYFPFKADMDSELKWTDARSRFHWLDFRDNRW